MTTTDISIKNVSDTAIWVAYYRAKESEREDALFHDPLAKVLIGERGKAIAEHMKQLGRYTEYAVITRTVIIDGFIQDMIREGIDTVINLGAGLDTRPYRMKLPKNLKWIEVDYPNIISLKNELLKSEVPQCQLSRVEVDLADDQKRKRFLADVGAQAKKALVLTEGVVIYLSEEQVATLATELHAQPGLKFWITEYFTPAVYYYLKKTVRVRRMKNAPIKFFPTDWMGFFAARGWVKKALLYNNEEGMKRGREIPMPWYAAIFKILARKAFLERSMKMSGYVLFEKK